MRSVCRNRNKFVCNPNPKEAKTFGTKSVRPLNVNEFPLFVPPHTKTNTNTHMHALIFLCVDERSERGCEHTDVQCAR